ncbi:MAG TPA: alpha/beta hydrolase [Solirubrobacteraceae bacterium]|nr:alpha/beta hydrolase [Solirubrobacteraceae bacterium]
MSAAPVAAAAFARRERTIAVGGRHVYVSERDGEGTPLLLITGLGGTVAMWSALRDALAPRPTIAFDLPGAGRSPAPRWPMSIPALARMTDELLDLLGVRRADVLGFSLGGLIAEQLAWSAPRHVRRLVLASTNAGWGSMPGHPRTFANLLSLRRLHDPEEFARQAPKLLGGLMRSRPELVRAAARARVAEPQSVRGYICQLSSCASWSNVPFLPLIRQPTLILCGDDDPLARPFNSRWMVHLIPRAQLHLIRGGGHYLVLERPDEFAEIVTDFLGAPRAAGPG